MTNVIQPITIINNFTKEADLTFVTKPICFGPKMIVKRERKVYFDEITQIYDTHSRTDINNHNLKQIIWWNKNDYKRFNKEANCELIIHLQHTKTNNVTAAKQHLWRGFIETNGDV